jgi:hypothetical protein
MRFACRLALIIGVVSVTCSVNAQQKDLTVEFIGPWAFVQTGSGIVAIAPSDRHSAPTFQAGASTTLVPGVYTLALSGTQAGNLPAGAVAAKLVDAMITAATLNSLVVVPPKSSSVKGHRFSIQMPPGGVFEMPPSTTTWETSEEASISPVFDPIAPNAVVYSKDVKIHYSVAATSFTLSGTADTGGRPGPFKSNGNITVSEQPEAGANHFCDYHARLAFMELNSLLQAGLFVDFPYYWDFCRQSWDPQKQYSSLSQFEARPAPPKKVDTKPILKLTGELEAAVSDVLPLDSDAHQLFEDTKAFLHSWEGPEHLDAKRGEDLAKRLKGLSDRLRDLRDENPILRAKRNQLLRELDLLGPVIMSGPSGRNCKAPIIGATVSN